MRMVTSLDKFDQLPGELGKTAGQGQEEAIS